MLFYFLTKRYSSSSYGHFNFISKSLLEIVTFLGTKKNNVLSFESFMVCLNDQSYNLKKSVVRDCWFCLSNEISQSLSISATFFRIFYSPSFWKDSTAEECQQLDRLDPSLVVTFPGLYHPSHSRHHVLLHLSNSSDNFRIRQKTCF